MTSEWEEITPKETTSKDTGGWEEVIPEKSFGKRTEEFFAEGFTGRAGTAIGERLRDAIGRDPNKGYHFVQAPPPEKDVPIGEALTQMGKAAVEHPIDTGVEMAKGMIKDPWMMIPALWTYTPAKLAAVAEKVMKGASEAKKLAAASTATAARAGVVMGGTEAGVEMLEKGEVDGSKVGTAAAAGAVVGGVLHPTLKGVGAGYRSIKEAALRNKKTGEVEPRGDKHGETRKEETKDTHDQGFIEKGAFIDRLAAEKKAKEAGDIAPDQTLVKPEEGLHSTDLENKATTDAAVGGERNPQLVEMHKQGSQHDPEIAKDGHTTKTLIEHLTSKLGPDHYVSKVLNMFSGAMEHFPVKILNREEMAKLNREHGLEENSPGAFISGKGIFLEYGRGTKGVIAAHEIAHAALHDKIKAIEGLDANHPQRQALNKLVEDVKGILDEVKKSVDLDSLPREHRSALEYAFGDVHEFISDGLFNPVVMERVLAVEKQRPTGALAKIVKALGEFFGLGPKDYTALHDLLGVVKKINEAKIKPGIQGAPKVTSTAKGSRLSQEIHDALEEEGIPLAHDSPLRHEGRFDWRRWKGAGEGHELFGAGTNLSSKDGVHFHYKEAFSEKLWNEKYSTYAKEELENNAKYHERAKQIFEFTLDKDSWEVDSSKSTSGERWILNKDVTWAMEDMYGPKLLHYVNKTPEGTYDARFKSSRDPIHAPFKTLKEAIDFLYKHYLDYHTKEEQRFKDELKAVDEKKTTPKRFLDETSPTYHVTLKAKPNEIMDWDAPLSRQPHLPEEAIVKAAKTGIKNAMGADDTTTIWNYHADGSSIEWNIRQIKPDEFEVKETFEDKRGYEGLEKASSIDRYVQYYKELHTGEDLYKQSADRLGSYAAVSDYLQSLGLVGHRFASAHRNGGRDSTYPNYIIYDDSRIKTNFVAFAKGSLGVTDFPPSKDLPSPQELKTDPRSIGTDKEFYAAAQHIYETEGKAAAEKFFDAYKEYVSTWVDPNKEIEKITRINLNNKEAITRHIFNEESRMNEQVPDPKRREAISDARERDTVAGLSKEEAALANEFKAKMEERGARAKDLGVIRGTLENYVSHIMNWEGAPPGLKEELIRDFLGGASKDPSMKGMSPETRFGKKRVFETLDDLQSYINGVNEKIAKKGESPWRMKIKTRDISEIYREYSLAVEKAMENKKLLKSLGEIRNPNGESMVRDITPDQPLPYGWEAGQGPQLAGKAIHPDLMPYLKFAFDAGPGDAMKALGTVSQLVKRFNVVGSFFHAKSLMEVLSSSHIPIWTPIKEGIVLPLVDKIAGTKLSAIGRAVEQYKNGGLGDNVHHWQEANLQLKMEDDITKGILSNIGKYADMFLQKYAPETRIMEKSLSKVEKYTLGLFDKYTWEFLHTGGKLFTADAMLNKARLNAMKEDKPFDEKASRIEIARHVNESFGGLNWFDQATQANTEMGKRIQMAAMSPAGRRGLQVALFAPDWTISTLNAFKSALPKELNPTKWHPIEGIKAMRSPKTKGDYARLYQFKTALTYFTLLNAINMMVAGRPIWDNKDPTRIEFKDGTSMQAMKHAMEPYHWIADPDKTLANKLGFIPKAVIVGLAGTEYASPTAQKLVDPSVTGRLKAVGGMIAPFQAQAAAGAPEGEGAKRALLGTMGFPVYGATPAQRKAARGEREKQLKEAARKYHAKAKAKGWE